MRMINAITKLFDERYIINTLIAKVAWIIIEANDKRKARLEAIRYVLSKFDYEGKDDAKTHIYPDPNIVQRFNRSMFYNS